MTVDSAHPTFALVSSEGFRVFRSRPGFFALALVLPIVPSMALGLLGLALQAEWMIRYVQHFGDLQWILANPAPASARLVGAVNYPVMILGYASAAALTARGGLDVLEGRPEGLVATARRCVRPILWMSLMDTVLAVGVWFGCACCFVPGIVGMGLVVTWLGLQTAALVSAPADWFQAAKESRERGRGFEGTLFALVVAYLAFAIVAACIAVAVGAGAFALANGGLTLDSPKVFLAAGIGYAAYTLAVMTCNVPALSWWMLSRACLYHRVSRRLDGRSAAGVFV